MHCSHCCIGVAVLDMVDANCESVRETSTRALEPPLAITTSARVGEDTVRCRRSSSSHCDTKRDGHGVQLCGHLHHNRPCHGRIARVWYDGAGLVVGDPPKTLVEVGTGDNVQWRGPRDAGSVVQLFGPPSAGRTVTMGLVLRGTWRWWLCWLLLHHQQLAPPRPTANVLLSGA
jgi:hypothetical protein